MRKKTFMTICEDQSILYNSFVELKVMRKNKLFGIIPIWKYFTFKGFLNFTIDYNYVEINSEDGSFQFDFNEIIGIKRTRP